MPKPNNRRKPMDGRYRIRSAITKPTGNNIFDTGMNGIIVKDNDKNIISNR